MLESRINKAVATVYCKARFKGSAVLFYIFNINLISGGSPLRLSLFLPLIYIMYVYSYFFNSNFMFVIYSSAC